MEERLSRLESQVGDLSRRLDRIESILAGRQEPEERVVELEPSAVPTADAKAVAGREEPAAASAGGVGGTIPLLGRTLLVLGGAFLLRWMTESQLVPPTTGLALGLTYAIVWIVLTDRAAARARRYSAIFHGLAAAAIGYPLLWESTARFHLISPRLGAVLLTAFALLAMVGAGLRSLKSLAWLSGLSVTGVAMALAFSTRLMPPFVAALLAAGIAALWLGYLKRWHLLAVSAAIIVDMVVTFLALLVLTGHQTAARFGVTGSAVLLIQLALIVSYLGSSTVQALLRGRRIAVLEMVQAVAVMVIGLGGGVLVSRATGADIGRLAVGTLALAAGGYGVSFLHMDRHRQQRWNFMFYTTLALVSAVVAIELLLGGTPRALALSGLALITALLGGRFSRVTLSMHSALYALAGALASGLLPRALRVFFTRNVELAGWGTVPDLLVFATTLVCFLVPTRTAGHAWGRWARLPKAALLAALLLVAGGLAVSATVSLISPDGGSPDPGLLATVRTAALSLIAVLLAAAGRWRNLTEATLLVYPILLLGAAKFLVDELPNGRPATLVFSLAIFGSALILSSTWSRRSAPPARN
jgi:hypothetical protein